MSPLKILAAIGLMSTPSFSLPLEDTAEVIEHCLVDEANEIEQCWKQILYEDGSSEVLASSEVDTFFWMWPLLAEKLQWQIESQNYINSLPVHYRSVILFDYNLLVRMHYLGDEEVIKIRRGGEPSMVLNNCDGYDSGQCASGIIGGAFTGGITGSLSGAKTGVLIGGPKGAAAGAVIGVTAGAIGGAATGHALTPGCSCKTSGGSSSNDKPQHQKQ